MPWGSGSKTFRGRANRLGFTWCAFRRRSHYAVVVVVVVVVLVVALVEVDLVTAVVVLVGIALVCACVCVFVSVVLFGVVMSFLWLPVLLSLSLLLGLLFLLLFLLVGSVLTLVLLVTGVRGGRVFAALLCLLLPPLRVLLPLFEG